MSIKTAFKDHLANNSLKNHFESVSLKDHLENNSLKNHWSSHWDYFFKDNLEAVVLRKMYSDTEIIFRKLSEKDLNGCSELFKEVFSSDPWYDDWRTLEQVRTFLNELVKNPSFEGFVAVENGKIVGVCMGHERSWWRGKEFFVDEFFVAINRQGNGIGTRLLEIVNDSLVEEGYTRLLLLTNKGIPAESFYLKNGFFNNMERTVMVKEIKN